MALQPNNYLTQERLQPGARGEMFQANIPGYRNAVDRMNRTNMKLNTSEHDVLNIKYQFDYRLPVLFTYGFANGFNQIVIPKGRIVAADPHMSMVDFESRKKFNTLTLANGGAAVKVRNVGTDKYTEEEKLVSAAMKGKPVVNGKEWIPTDGFTKTYDKEIFRPFKDANYPSKQLTAATAKIDPATGKVVDKSNNAPKDDYRPGNVPLGIIGRNEYTRDDDAYNGMMPGPVLTDALVELPWFAFKDKAEQNPWGSAYGDLFAGALVRSDENGRFVLSALNFPEKLAEMKMDEYELERQQVVGQVYATNTDLVPEGAAKFATWALEDRLNSEEFNPAVYAKTNRRGEDAVASSPFHSTGTYPGYPFDKNFLNHDLHMLASDRLGNYDPRMNPEFQYNDLGIPGLTDGGNAVSREMGDKVIGTLHYAGEDKDYEQVILRLPDVNIEKDSLKIALGKKADTACVVGLELESGAATVKYCSLEQGVIILAIDKAKGDALLKEKKEGVEVHVSYNKRGMAGVPTFMDWDGAIGSVKILLTK